MSFLGSLSILIRKYSTPLIHISAWSVFFLLPIIFSSSDFSESEKNNHDPDEFFLLHLINKVFKIGVFYINTKWLIAIFLYKRKFFIFFISQLLMFMLLIGIDYILFHVLQINHTFHIARSAYHNISLFLFISLSSIAFKLVSDKVKTEEKQNENLKTELSFLRSQISPHFLFNILNNIVAMVRLKHDALEDTVVKLSSLLQYMLYETDEEKVSIQSETEYLRSYIDLQSLRFGNKISISTNLEVKESLFNIEPMLLIPFVENAFKHGYGMVENPEISISLFTQKDGLVFKVKNKYSEKEEIKDKTSGIGLNNVSRRLDLLYPKNHTLEISTQDGWFSVNLYLNLKKS
jgi:two-component system LytT family sensor kinase